MPELKRMPGITFLGEQDGPAERDFKAAVRHVLTGRVRAAYLARVVYPGETDESVSICLRSAGPQESTADQIGEVFAEMFTGSQHLDVVFLDEEAERELSKVCQPFFESE